MRANTRLGAGILAVAVLAGAGTVLGSYPMYLLSLACVTVISAVGLNILTGNAGQISLCHSSFMAIGAYASTLLTIHLGIPFWAAIPCGTALAAFAGLLVGAPAMRLGGIYLALVTLGFLQIVQIGIEEMHAFTGGVRGLAVPKASLHSVALTDYGRYLIVLGYCAVAVWIAHNLLASRVGREMNAVRQSSQAAQALGISLQQTKLMAFALSAAYAGAAGGLLAMLVGFLDPMEFGVSSAIRYITYIVVGGIGSLGGSILGAGLLSALPELLRPVKEYGDLVYTLILLGFLLFMPRGLVTPWKVVAIAVHKRRAGAAVGKS
ncbi:MAG: branched-chain amino acid ABC transporter permease [Comamonadaceae bacterium]|nr:MAG: branched-chain amino acid ABC transporter permease [Comamonadaceae bacterium]